MDSAIGFHIANTPVIKLCVVISTILFVGAHPTSLKPNAKPWLNPGAAAPLPAAPRSLTLTLTLTLCSSAAYPVVLVWWHQ